MIAVLNLSVYSSQDGDYPVEMLQALFEECAHDLLFQDFPPGSSSEESSSSGGHVLLGQSIVSASLRNKVLSQREFFWSLALEVQRVFPGLPAQQFFNFTAIVRKYALFFRDSSELSDLPLFSVPVAEYFDSSSNNPNAKINPFFNFMAEKVSGSGNDRTSWS